MIMVIILEEETEQPQQADTLLMKGRRYKQTNVRNVMPSLHRTQNSVMREAQLWATTPLGDALWFRGSDAAGAVARLGGL